MKYSSTNKPLVCMQTTSTCYKGTRTMNVLGILVHSTGANNPTLKRYVQPSDSAADKAAMLKKLGTNTAHNDWNHIYREAGLNAWIGKLADGTVTTVQTMPWNYRPWGCGSGKKGSCNDGWIQFEICEDALNDKSYFDKIYKEATELIAYLCKMYDINPKGSVTYNGIKVPTILCHNDSYKLGLGNNHSDIYHWWNKYGKNMVTLRDDVAALLNPPKPVTPTPVTPKPVTPKPEVKTTTVVTTSGIAAKTKLVLKAIPLYISATSIIAASKKTGTYYAWDNKVTSGRIKITNAIANCGVSGKVTGWINLKDAKAAVQTKTTTTTTKTVAAKTFPKYTGTTSSIVTALNSLKITSTYAYRAKIAKANGIKAYVGTAKQNTQLLTLLKQGKLIKP